MIAAEPVALDAAEFLELNVTWVFDVASLLPEYWPTLALAAPESLPDDGAEYINTVFLSVEPLLPPVVAYPIELEYVTKRSSRWVAIITVDAD